MKNILLPLLLLVGSTSGSTNPNPITCTIWSGSLDAVKATDRVCAFEADPEFGSAANCIFRMPNGALVSVEGVSGSVSMVRLESPSSSVESDGSSLVSLMDRPANIRVEALCIVRAN